MTYTTNIILTEKYEVLKPVKVLLAGLAATAVMTIFMLIGSATGLLQINTGILLGALLGGHVALGWIAHLVIGCLFAFIYVMFFNHTLPVINDIFRGTLFGIIVFVFSEMTFFVINFTGVLTWDQKEGMALMVFGNCIAHLIYGAVLGAFFKNK